MADDVEQGELDAGLVIDLGCAAPELARTTLRADLPACWCLGARVLDKESIPLAELRGQRVLLPSLRQDLFSRCGRPAPGWALRRMRRSAPAFISLLSCAGAALHLSDPL